jgi:hypothetical protein
MATITTTRGDMDDAALVKTEVLIENDHERTAVVEYCLLGCDGPWHRTHQGDGEGVFCAQHVHRSVSMHLKRGIELAAIVGDVG